MNLETIECFGARGAREAGSVLVTGASGFLGGAVCRALAAEGWRVVATGRNEARLRGLAEAGVAAGFCAGDLAAGEFAGKLPVCDAVVHCAALSSPWGRWRDFKVANVEATARVLAHARRCGARGFVHISSPTVFHRSCSQVNVTERTPWPGRAVNLYAASKRESERLVRESGLRAVILRPRALFGPGDTVLLPRIIGAARAGRLPVIGDGLALTDFTYIDNAADSARLAVARACSLRVGESEDFNITNGEPVALWPTLRALLARLGVPAPRRSVPLGVMRAVGRAAEFGAWFTGREPRITRYGAEVLGYSQTFDISKARAVLGYQPRVGVEEGIGRFVAWWREQEAGGAGEAGGVQGR